jgi:alpha-acetolactate decarboxylase
MGASTKVNGELVWLTDKAWKHTPMGASVTMANGLTMSPFALVVNE